MGDDSAEFLFQKQKSSSGMGRDVHSLMLSIQHFLSDHGVAHPSRCPKGWFWRGCRGVRHTEPNPLIMSGRNHLAGHSERGKKTRQTEEVVGRQHQGMDRPGVRQVPEGSGDQGKMEKTGCKIICGAPTTLAVKGMMMMMMMMSGLKN